MATFSGNCVMSDANLFVLFILLVACWLALHYWQASRTLQYRLAGLDIGSCVGAIELDQQTGVQQALTTAMNHFGMQLLLMEHGRIIHVGNRQLAYRMGYTDAQIDAFPSIVELVHPDDRAKAAELQRRCISSPVLPALAELGLITRDGERVEFEIALAKVPGSKPTRIIGIGRDINQRKHREAALAERERAFRSLAESAPDPILRYDREGRRIYANRCMPGRAEHHDVKAACCHPSHTEWEVIRQVVATGKPGECEVAFRAPTGNLFIFHNRYMPEFGADGQVASVVSVCRDITAFKHMLEALHQKEHGLAEAQRIAHLGHWAFDLSDNRLEWSDEVFALFEVAREQFIPSYDGFFYRVHPEDRDHVHQTYSDSLRSWGPCDVQHRLLFADGRVKHVHQRWETHFADDGTPLRSVGTVQDITAIKEAEIRLRQSRDLLRALAIHHDNQHEAERRDIVRTIHEDLAQNLSALRLGLARLDGQAMQLAGMQQLIDSSLRLIRDMVATLRPSVLDLGIGATLHWLAEDFGRGLGLRFILDIDDTLSLDDETTTFLFRAAQEILVNAALYAAAHTISVTLALENQHCVLAIRDDGCGFNPLAPREADAFGLLRISEQAASHGGDMQIDSAPGQGARVQIRLPVPRQIGPQAGHRLPG